MKTVIAWVLAALLCAVSAVAAAEQVTAVSSAAKVDAKIAEITGTAGAPMTLARFGPSGEELYAGDECPVGSGSYCSDESPHCFLCKGDYACCWTSEVWRCCD